LEDLRIDLTTLIIALKNGIMNQLTRALKQTIFEAQLKIGSKLNYSIFFLDRIESSFVPDNLSPQLNPILAINIQVGSVSNSGLNGREFLVVSCFIW
jgi:hypothetical protein